jgi:hypothetical protein
MRVLVATTGARPGRVRPLRPETALEGELVRPPVPACADPACDCDRVWMGLASDQAATTGLVVELAIQRAGLLAAFTDALCNQGRLDPADDEEAEWVADLVDQHLELARAHPVSTLVDLRDGEPVAPLCRAS